MLVIVPMTPAMRLHSYEAHLPAEMCSSVLQGVREHEVHPVITAHGAHTHTHGRACLRCESRDNGVSCKPSHHVSLLTVIARLPCSHTFTHRQNYAIVVTKARTTERRRLTGCDAQSCRLLTRATELGGTCCSDI